jgi:hypothetical protein
MAAGCLGEYVFMSEHQESKALIQWRDLNLGKYPCLKNLIHIPNGGMRNLRVAQKLKAEGVKAGVSDYLLPTASITETLTSIGYTYMRYNGLWIELKVGRNKPTESQDDWLHEMRGAGYAAYWCIGWEEAAALIIAYLECKPMIGREPTRPKKET